MTDKPPKNYIPKMRQLTPEMEARNKERAQKIRRAKRREEQLKRWGVSLLIIGLPALAIGYTYLATRNDDTEVVRELDEESLTSDAPKNSFESLLEKGTESELFDAAEECNQEIMTGELPKQLLAYRKRIRIADAFLGRDKASSEAIEFGITKKIDALVSLASLNNTHNLTQPEIVDELVAFSIEHLNSSDPTIKEHALLGLAIAKAYRFVLDNSDANFEAVRNGLEDLFSKPVSLSPQHLIVLHNSLGLSQNKDKISELRKVLVEKLRISPNQTQHDLASVLNDELILGRRDFEMLRHLVSMSNQSAINELVEINDAIAASPDLSVDIYRNVILALDAVRESHQKEKEPALRAQLKTAAANIPDEGRRQDILKLLDEYQVRLNLIGTKFQLNSGAPAEQKLDPKASATAITFLNYDAEISLNFLKAWAQYDMVNVNEQFLIVTIGDTAPDTERLAQMQAAFPQALFINAPFNKYYTDLCPLSFVPYIVVLDSQQIVRGVNVSLGKFREMVISLGKNEATSIQSENGN